MVWNPDESVKKRKNDFRMILDFEIWHFHGHFGGIEEQNTTKSYDNCGVLFHKSQLKVEKIQ